MLMDFLADSMYPWTEDVSDENIHPMNPTDTLRSEKKNTCDRLYSVDITSI